MVQGQLEPILHHLRKLSEPCAADRSDAELLRCFAACREEGAFAALMQRHGPLVLSVCRRVLRHEQDAEDAFQATFLVLARRADSIRCEESLASWLHGVALRTALRARTIAANRSAAREETRSPAEPPAEASLRELQRLLDEEVTQLPEKYRAPFVLCYLQGLSRDEAARQLGWNKGTLSGRLALARLRLQQRLARRGVTLAAALCAVALGPNARAAASTALTGAVSTRAVVLAEGVLRAMSLTRIRFVAALLFFVALSAGAGMTVLATLPGELPQAEPPPPARQAEMERGGRPKDAAGDALPGGAVARLGTVRFRTRGGSPYIAHRASPGVAFLPGDKTLVAVAGGVLEFLDVATGKEVRRSETPGWTWAYTLSPDGKTLAGYIHNGEVHLWDATTGKELAALTGEQGWFESAAFSADGRTLIAATKRPETVYVWEAPTGKEVRRFKEPHGTLAVGIAPDGKTLATADWASTSTIRLRETATGKELGSFEARGQVRQLVFAPDGKTLAAVEPWDGASNLHLWDVAGNKLRLRLPMRDYLEGAAFSPDGKLLATAHRETFHVWDVTTGTRVERFEGNVCFTADVAFSGDGKLLATTGDNTIRLWDVATGKEVASPGAGHRGTVEALTFLADGKTLVTAGGDHTLRHWDAATGKEVRQFPDLRGAVVKSFADEGKLLVLRDGKEVRLCDAVTGKELHRFAYPDHVFHIALTADGNSLAVYTGGKDKKVRMVDARTGKERLAQQYAAHVQAVALSPGGEVLALGLVNGSFLLVDAITGNELYRIQPGNNVAGFAFSRDGRMLATALVQGGFGLWEVATGKERIRRTEPRPGAMAFSLDGRLLALGDDDGTIRLWATATGKQLHQLRGHRSEITCLAFAADGKTLASGSRDTTALVWDLSSLLSQKAVPGEELTARELDALWNDLAGEDAIKAYRAIQTLTAAPGQTVPFLKDRLRPISAVEPKQTRALLADLDRDDFDVREKASAELEKLGESVEAAIRKALEGKPSAEVRRRAGALLQKLRRESLGRERLRELRALEALERVGGPEVRQLLRRLAEGLPTARLTQESRAALGRLETRAR